MKKYLFWGLMVVVLAAVALAGYKLKGQTKVGSVPIANEYHFIQSTPGAGVGVYETTLSSTTAPFALGSMIISSSSAAGITFYDWNGSTSTATSTLVYFPPNTPQGVYTFDVAITKGLYVGFDTVTNTGYITITWR